MANEKKAKSSKNKNADVKSASTMQSPTGTPKKKGSKKPPTLSPPTDEELSHSLSDLEGDEDEEQAEVNDGEEEADEEKNDNVVGWPKPDDLELFKRIQKACPKEDSMKYDSRVNHLDWETVKFQEYSADQCKTRWLFVQKHLRHYRILSEVLEDAVSWVDRPWYNFNKGGKNNQKHPEQPKKPLTSYMLFYMEQKDAILEKQPGLGMTDLSKLIAKMYHELSDRKKAKYAEIAEKEKESYHLKMKKFLEDHPDYVLPKSKQSVKAVLPKLPTPFKLYSDACMTKYMAQGLSTAEAREQCRETYKLLSEKKKLKWIYQALKRESEYNEEMEKFKSENPEVDIPSKKMSLLTKDELQIKHKNEGKPDKPPNSGYSLFSKKLLSSNSLKQFETKERMSEISRMWKELSEEEKAAYNDKAHEMNYTYKMKYASYLETLTPEQRNAELISSVTRGTKRGAPKMTDQQVLEKKSKSSKDIASSDASSDEDIESDEDDFQVASKPAIQKPNSSLQMFCNSNMEKYTSKYPKLSKQELTRLMAKEFAKLSEENKKIYGKMALKSKTESSASKPAKTNSPQKAKASKAGPASKKEKDVKSSTTALNSSNKSPERAPKTPAKAPAVDSKILKSPSKVKPSLNANLKSVPGKESPKTLAKTKGDSLPAWAANQSLFNKKEPPKPPESAAAYYALVNHSKSGHHLTSSEIDSLWGQLPEKQKKKVIEEHKKKQKEYVGDFENFIRTLSTSELKSFRAFMKNRERREAEKMKNQMDDDEDDDDDESSAEEVKSNNSSNDDESSINGSSDDSPQLSSEEN